MRYLRPIGRTGSEPELKITVDEHFSRPPRCSWERERSGKRHRQWGVIHVASGRASKRSPYHTIMTPDLADDEAPALAQIFRRIMTTATP